MKQTASPRARPLNAIVNQTRQASYPQGADCLEGRQTTNKGIKTEKNVNVINAVKTQVP